MKASTLLLCALVALATAACGTTGHDNEMPVSAALGPMPKPRMNVGDKWYALMTNKLVKDKEVVVTNDSLERGVVKQSRSDGCRWTTLVWGFAPPSRWSGCNGSSGRRKITNVRGEIWPLRIGKKISYSFTANNQSGNNWKGTQTCRVASQVRIPTASGTHDTFKVVCEDPWTTRIWYVSPKLETTIYYVRHRRDKDVTTTFEMVRFEKAGRSP